MIALLAGVAALVAADSPGEHVGINVHIAPDDVLDAVQASGMRWIRVDNNWVNVESQQGTYDFAELDRLIDSAVARNLHVFMTVAYTPVWASTGDTLHDGPNNDVPTAGAYDAYVRATVTHFMGRVAHYGMWNEPNLNIFWEGSADQYRTLILEPGSRAVHGACPTCRVLAPDVASISSWDQFLTPVLMGSAASIDVLSFHDYGSFTELGWNPLQSDGYINKLDMRRAPFTLPSLRDIMMSTNTTGLPVWITETGYRANPPLDPNEEMRQATYVRRVLEEDFARPWVQNTFFYEIADAVGSTIDGFGVLRRTSTTGPSWQNDFVQKPAFMEIEQFISMSPDAGTADASDGGAATAEAGAPDARASEPADTGTSPAPPDAGPADRGSADAPPAQGPSDAATVAGEDGAASSRDDRGAPSMTAASGCGCTALAGSRGEAWGPLFLALVLAARLRRR